MPWQVFGLDPPARLALPALAAILGAALALHPTAGVGDNETLGQQRQLFVSTDEALKRGDTAELERHRDALQPYPLYPYLLYRDLKRRLAEEPEAEIRSFVITYDDCLLAARLRSSWLRHLAQQRRWRDFLDLYHPSNDTALACYQRQALLHTDRKREALEGIEAVWMNDRSQPDACDPLFKLWHEQGGITRERIWKRLGLALDADQPRLARYLTGRLPARDRPQARLWLEVHRQPQRLLEIRQFDPDDSLTPTIILHGIRRWGRRDSLSAAIALDALKQRYRFPRDELSRVERQLALFVASRGDPSALARLTALPAPLVDAPVQEWRVRTQLRQRDWRSAREWLDAMVPELRQKPQWQYWYARALEQLDQRQRAEGIYRDLAQKRDYHGFLAADRLDLPYQLNDVPLAIPAAQVDALLARHPGLQRARELYYLERIGEARSEWRYTIRALAKSELATAAKLAQRWDWHSEIIITLARAEYWDDLALRFPTPYRDSVLAATQRNTIDPAWVYAIMRQESAFQADAKSGAGALGLMQILPATGRRIAADRKLGIGDNTYALLRTDTNILLGTYYLQYTLTRLQDNPLLATAAYNAGPNRVIQWLPERNPIDADLWAETIPFKETRHYVKRVMEYAVVYGQRLGNPAVTLSARMRAVQPGQTP